MRVKVVILVLILVLFGAALGAAFGIFGTSGILKHLVLAGSSQSLAIDQDLFVRAYVELALLAESMPIGTPEYDREKERVLGRLGLEPGQVEAALARFGDRPDLWRPVWEKIQIEIEKRESGLSPVAPQADTTIQTEL